MIGFFRRRAKDRKKDNKSVVTEGYMSDGRFTRFSRDDLTPDERAKEFADAVYNDMIKELREE